MASFLANMTALQSFHRFGDIYEEAINTLQSDIVEFTAVREAKDSIGPHWYGMRCKMICRKTMQGFYLHTGLIFLPETRTGLMVEVDKKNNSPSYSDVWNNITSATEYEVEKGEAEYLKLFMPDAEFDSMRSMNKAGQIKTLTAYIKACGEAIAVAASQQGFSLTYTELLSTYALNTAVQASLAGGSCEDYKVEINASDPDNFGQYASGYRYYLSSPCGGNKMYAYFGSIYSYKKSPSGIFAEIDQFSNPDIFDKVKQNFVASAEFEYSDTEPKFIKLFMPQKSVELLNALPEPQQLDALKQFLHSCN
ncbi:MAG: hypothetical protein RSC38_07845, partial [Oscillospiraceae bacterium]